MASGHGLAQVGDQQLVVLHAVVVPEAGLLTGPPPTLLSKWVQALKQAK